ncbi:hypothetical protein E2C01_026883 [Portunus trituberculatus]|uniref:Uncharacterized protein n=1 Tax=Portunus trituberculatus TaxID=210409 RepID=A0A5B7EGH2_PORTR|nr:hypothetical protein [Portunus trituberculatus]
MTHVPVHHSHHAIPGAIGELDAPVGIRGTHQLVPEGEDKGRWTPAKCYKIMRKIGLLKCRLPSIEVTLK